MKIRLQVSSAADTENVGRELGRILEENRISSAFIALYGEMGVGKTAFTRGFALHFGIRSVKSPTYTVLNEYRGRSPVHHFDFYRISDENDLYSVGYFDIIESGGYTVGEWSENIADFLPEDSITVSICKPDGARDADIRDIVIDIPETISLAAGITEDEKDSDDNTCV